MKIVHSLGARNLLPAPRRTDGNPGASPSELPSSGAGKLKYRGGSGSAVSAAISIARHQDAGRQSPVQTPAIQSLACSACAHAGARTCASAPSATHWKFFSQIAGGLQGF